MYQQCLSLVFNRGSIRVEKLWRINAVCIDDIFERRTSAGRRTMCRGYRLAPLRLARRLRSVNSVLYLIRAALTSSKQTLYRISAARISALDTISNGRLAFMKMTGDAGPPERILVYTYREPVNGSSYRTGGEKEEFTRAPRSIVDGSGGTEQWRRTVVVESSSGASHQRDLVGKWLTSWNAMVPPTGMQWAGVCGRFTSFDKGGI